MTEFSKYDIEISYQGNSYEWHEAVNSGLICPTVYKWDENQYQSALTLSPWGAYWINTSNDNVVLKFGGESDYEARVSDSEDYEIKLHVLDNIGDASSDEIRVSLSDVYSTEFIYGEDEYNLESFVKPDLINSLERSSSSKLALVLHIKSTIPASFAYLIISGSLLFNNGSPQN